MTSAGKVLKGLSETQQDTYRRWWQGSLGRPIWGASRLQAEPDTSGYSWWTGAYPFEVPAETIVEQFQAQVAGTDYLGEGFPFFLPNFGPGVLAAPMGSRPLVGPDTIWFEPIPNLNDLEDWMPRFAPAHPWWQRVLAISQAACRRLPADIPVAFTDLGGNLDILSALLGAERLLVELLDHPERVDRWLSVITDIWLAAYWQSHALLAVDRLGTTYWAPALWAPGPSCMFQSDFSYMISPALFERFVLPDLTRCCEEIEYSFYHLDGPGQIPHLPHLLQMKKLKGVQWIPGAGNPPASKWPQVIEPILDAGKLCQVFVTVEEALEILDRFPGGGFSLAVTDPAEGPLMTRFLDRVGR